MKFKGTHFNRILSFVLAISIIVSGLPMQLNAEMTNTHNQAYEAQQDDDYEYTTLIGEADSEADSEEDSEYETDDEKDGEVGEAGEKEPDDEDYYSEEDDNNVNDNDVNDNIYSLVIEGIVTSTQEDNPPLMGVNIEFQNGTKNLSTETNIDGFYEIVISNEETFGELDVSDLFSDAVLNASLYGYMDDSIDIEDFIQDIKDSTLNINFRLTPMGISEGMARVEGIVTLDDAAVLGARVYFNVAKEVNLNSEDENSEYTNENEYTDEGIAIFEQGFDHYDETQSDEIHNNEDIDHDANDEKSTFIATTDENGKFSILLPATDETHYSVLAAYEPRFGEEGQTESLALSFGEGTSILSSSRFEHMTVSPRAISEPVELVLSEGDNIKIDFELEFIGIRALQTIEISTAQELTSFLMNTLGGTNTEEFVLMNDIEMGGQGTFQGRGFVSDIPFMGIFRGSDEFITREGRNPEIRGLSLIPRQPSEAVDVLGRNDVGFIRALGHGALIENITFAGSVYNEGAIADWNTTIGNIGFIAGRIVQNATVTINNVAVHGANADANATMTFAGGARETNNKRVGGFVGFVDSNATLNLDSADVRLQVDLNTTGTPGSTANRNVRYTGGFIGATAGNVNITGADNTAHLVTSIGTAGGSRAFLYAGAAIGRITTPPAIARTTIENLTVTGTIIATTTGGIVGANTSNAANSLIIDNSTSNITSSTLANIAGGFVGNVASATITDSINNSVINIGVGTAGGFVGQGTSAGINSITLRDVTNNANITANTAAGGLVGAGQAITIERAQNHATIAGTSHRGGLIGISRATVLITDVENRGATSLGNDGAPSIGTGGIIGNIQSGSATLTRAYNYANLTVRAGRLGGLIGRTQGSGSVNISHSENRGAIRAYHTNTSTLAAGRTSRRNHVASAGGFVGYIDGTLNVADSENHGDVFVNGTGGAGGIVGLTPTRSGSTTNLTRVSNHASISGRDSRDRDIGGLIGRSRNPVTIIDSVNYGNISLEALVGNGLTNNNNHLGGFIGLASNRITITNGENRGHISTSGSSAAADSGRLRLGGFVGQTMHQTTITNAVNHANVFNSASTATNAHHYTHGGIVGRIQWAGRAADRHFRITDTINYGNIGFNTAGAAAMAGGAGGMIGNATHRAGVRTFQITNVQNMGAVRARTTAGGIIGYGNALNMTINRAINRGEVSHQLIEGTAGGIAGRTARNNLTIQFAGNEGAVFSVGTATITDTTARGVGGIIGLINRGTRIRIMNSYNAGSVEGGARGTGGIIGGIRRRGTTLIQDVYNVGAVHGRLHTTSGTNTTNTQGPTGHGILGFRRNIVGTVTMERVFNSGNVSGDPIFRGTQGASGPNNLVAQARRRMVYRNVFYDISTHTGAPMANAQGVPNRVIPGIQGVPTSTLTSGGLSAFNTNQWRIHGWIENIENEVETWESYPFLAWQINNAEREEDFFTRIEPGADYEIGAATSRTVDFIGIRDWSGDDGSSTRSFIPYSPRASNQAPIRQHQLRSPGDHLGINVTNINSVHTETAPGRMSVGLISPRGVVGFSGNELFEPIALMGVDEVSGNLVSWSRIYMNGAFQDSIIAGILQLDYVEEGQVARITGLGYEDTYYTLTEEHVEAWQEAVANERRFVIRVPMRRAPIDNLRVEVRNATPDADVPPLIVAARNPNATRTPWQSGETMPLAAAGNAAIFDASGSYWGDILSGMADGFYPFPGSLELEHSMIEDPTASPLVVRIILDDIRINELDVYIARMIPDEDHEDGFIESRMPHGGRGTAETGGGTDFRNPFMSPHFEVEIRNPYVPANSDIRSLAGTGNGTGGATAVRDATRWEARTLTELSEIRVVPRDGLPIPGTGGNWTFRPSAWIPIDEITSWSDEDGAVETREHATVHLMNEHHIRVDVVESINVIEGQDHRHIIHIPNSQLHLEADMGLDEPLDGVVGGVTWRNGWRLIEGTNGVFNPVIILDGEMLEGSAPGFITGFEEASVPEEDEDQGTVYIELERLPSGRLYGFTLNASMIINPENLAVVGGADVTILDSRGNIANSRPIISDANGFFYYEGLSAGTYTVLATHPQFAGNVSVPNPVVISENIDGTVENARVNIFLDHDEESGFMLFVNVVDINSNNISEKAKATLTYDADTSPRVSVYTSPFLIRHLNTNLNWINGVMLLEVEGFAPKEVNIAAALEGQDLVEQRFAVITVVMVQMIEDLEVWVVLGDNVPRTPLLITTSSIVYSGTANVTGAPNGSGMFNIDLASVGNAITASAPGFNSATHTITPEDAALGLIVIPLTEPINVNNFTVRVVDERGIAITTARLTQPYTAASGTGIFTLAAQVGQTIGAIAPGFSEVTRIISYADAAAGELTITLMDSNRIPIHPFRVYVRNSNGDNIETASLLRGTETFSSTTGAFEIPAPGVTIGDTFSAEAPGFVSGDHTITYLNAANNEAIITLSAAPIDITVRVVDANDSPIPTATLTHPSLVPTGAGGVFTLSGVLGDVHIGSVLTASAPGFSTNNSRQIGFADLDSPRIITIQLSGSNENDAVSVTVNVVNSAGANITTASLTKQDANVVGTNGTFTISVMGDEIGQTLVASAAGFESVSRDIVAIDLAGDRVITITLDEYVDVELTVSVLDTNNDLLESASLVGVSRITPLEDGRFTVIVSGQDVGTSLAASALGLNTATRMITFEDLLEENRHNIEIILGLTTFYLNVNNVPEGLTHEGQSAIANDVMLEIDTEANPVSFGRQITLTAGEVEENHEFLGWYKGLSAPEIGTPVSTLSEVVTANMYTFSMPAEDIQFFALWGGNGIVGAPSNRVTFHIYDSMKNIPNESGVGVQRVPNRFNDSAGGYRDSIVVPVVFGEAMFLDDIITWMEDDESGHAFWGWFTDAELDASGRVRGNGRRPTLGTQGFNLSTIFTQESFDELAVNGNIDLYAIWGLWGDVNDDDLVNMTDVNMLQQYVFVLPNVRINRNAARVTRGTNPTMADVNLIQQHVFLMPGSEIPLPRIVAQRVTRSSPFASIAQSMVQIAAVAKYKDEFGIDPLSIGDIAIWELTKTVGESNTYMDVRIELTQNTAFGMGATGLMLSFNNEAVANPRLSPRLIRADLSEAQQQFYDFLRSTDRYTDEQLAVYFRDSLGSNHTVKGMSLIPPRELDGDVGLVNFGWMPVSFDGFWDTGLFLDIRFDILEGASAEDANIVYRAHDGNDFGTFYSIMGGSLPIAHPSGLGGNPDFVVLGGAQVDDEGYSDELDENKSEYENESERNNAQTAENERRTFQELNTRLIYGYPNGTVRADAQVTRAEVAMIIFRILRLDNNNTASSIFSDIDESSWYADAINRLANEGVLYGYPDRTFRPNETITKAEFAAIVARFFEARLRGVTLTDESSTHWASAYIEAVINEGWFTDNQAMSHHDEAITRAEVIITMIRAMGLTPDEVDSETIFSDLTHNHPAFGYIVRASRG